MAEQASGTDSRDIEQFVGLLLEALRRSGQSQAALAAVMYYSKSLLTNVIKGGSTPEERFFHIFFERGVPFLIAFRGVDSADEVRAMAKAAGVRLTDAELRVAAQGARDPEFLAQTSRQGGADDDVLTAADLRLTNEYAKARADTFEQSIQPPAAPTQPALARVLPDPMRWLDTIDQLSARHCGHTPAVFGRQMHIVETSNRLVWLEIEEEGIPFHGVYEALEGRSALLAGVPGSGRTTLLRGLGYHLIGNWRPGRPQAVYVRAPELLKWAGRRRNVVELLAEQIVAAGGAETHEIRAVTAAVDDLDRDRRLVWLVDDVDRLSGNEQADLAGHFVASQAIYVVSPWQAKNAQERLSTDTPPIIVSVPSLHREEQSNILDTFFQEWSETLPSVSARGAVLDMLPDLAELPIGLAAIHAQMEAGRVTPLLILEAAAREYFARSGLDFPTDWSDWPILPPAVRALTALGSTYVNDRIWYESESGGDFVTIDRFHSGVEAPFRSDWYTLPATRQCLLTEVEGRPVANFFNDDLLCYWAARRHTSPWYNSQKNLRGRARSLVDRINALRAEAEALASKW